MTTESNIDRSRATDYETIFILRSDIDSDASEKAIARTLAAIEQGGGKLLKVESWGKRRLAFAIGKQRRGFYVYFRYLGYRGLVAEVERNLRMLDTVLRHMTVALRKNVDPTTMAVDPDEIKVRRIEIVEHRHAERSDAGERAEIPADRSAARMVDRAHDAHPRIHRASARDGETHAARRSHDHQTHVTVLRKSA
jgi:small subunit ribosomal protein S6